MKKNSFFALDDVFEVLEKEGKKRKKSKAMIDVIKRIKNKKAKIFLRNEIQKMDLNFQKTNQGSKIKPIKHFKQFLARINPIQNNQVFWNFLKIPSHSIQKDK